MSSPTPSGKLSVRELCILAFFAALMFSVKTVLASIPNVNLNALLIILVTVYFGWRALYAVGVYILLEGLIFGFSIWWFSYLYIWPVLVVLAMLFRRNESALVWAVLAGVYGLLFGPLMYIGYFAITGGWRSYAAMWIAGIPYDLIHAVSNFLTVLILFKPLSKIMNHFVPSA